MTKPYSETNTLKKLADSMVRVFREASVSLPFAKGFTGTVLSKEEGVCRIRVKGAEKRIRTDYPFVEGEQVLLLSLQNQPNDLVVLPTYAQLKKMVEQIAK